MSGHNKWSSIKHQKAATDAKKGAIFTKLTREIIIAVRAGGPSVEANYSLRLAVQRAKDSSMPWENINRAIQKASGGGEGTQLEEMVLEGYAPGGAAILVQATSDNHNRTVQTVRNVFQRAGGNMSESGSVAWLFDNKGIITIKGNGIDADELGLKAIDAGADDVTTDNDYITIYTSPKKLWDVRAALEKDKIAIESAEVTMVAKQMVDLDEKASVQTLKLMEKLEELDDVSSVSSNVNFSDASMAAYQQAVA